MGRKKKAQGIEIVLSAEDIIQKDVTSKFLSENDYWELYQQEYDVVPMMKGLGKGDLVFCNKDLEKFHVIECKNHSPKETQEQAEYYAAWVKMKHPSHRVTYQFVVGNEWSIIYDIDITKAVLRTLTKIHSLQGLTNNELSTLSQIYASLFVHRSVFIA